MSESNPLLNESVELGGQPEAEDASLRWYCLPFGVARLARKYLVNINLLLGFAPLGFLAAALEWHAVVISAFNFVAIIPLSVLISDASDTIGNRWGSLVGGLVNATFGNTVELTVGILAIHHGETGLAQSTMLGSILSDILLVQCLCFIAAARSSGVLAVNAAVVDTLSSLMLITAVALILPTVLYSTFPHRALGIDIEKKILSFSRATAVALLALYIVYLYFQMKTHKDIFIEEKDDVDHDAYGDGPVASAGGNGRGLGQEGEDREEGENGDDDDDDIPSMREVYIATAVLLASGAVVGKCTHHFIESLDGMTQTLGITKTFVAIVLIPMISNACEMSQVVAASRKKINFAVGVIISSILQIALFVLPFLVVIGWLIDRPMDLSFETSQTYILLLAVMLVNQVLQDGQCTYLHGVMLLSMYIIIAMAYLVEPYN